ncbi:MAG: hypothetical protein RI885_480 [Actinomycetota bacterium]
MTVERASDPESAISASPAAPRQPRTVVLSRGIGTTRAPSARTLLVGLMVMAVVATALVGLLGAWMTRADARSAALDEAIVRTDLLADTIVARALRSGLDSTEPELTRPAEGELRDGVAEVLDGGWILAVKLWKDDGSILWADDSSLIGRTFDFPSLRGRDLSEAADRVAVTDVARPENASLDAGAGVLEVYRSMESPAGTALLLEVQVSESVVQARTSTLWAGLSAPLLAAMVILVLLLVPATWALLHRSHRRREGLLRRGVESARLERERVAGRLHDGAVQDIAAATLEMDGLVERARQAGDPGLGMRLRAVAERVRQAAKEQRGLLEDLYPPELTESALLRMIDDAAEPARAAGVSVEVTVAERAAEAIASGEQEVVRRLLEEVMRNAARHSSATTARVTVGIENHQVALEIADDGAGFDPGLLDDPASGHLGTRVVADLARDAGAELVLRTAPGAGTSWRLTLPVRPE